MEHVTNALARRLGEHLSLSLARLNCMSALVLALIRSESVSLRKLSLRLGGAAKKESQYRRLQRFFSHRPI